MQLYNDLVGALQHLDLKRMPAVELAPPPAGETLDAVRRAVLEGVLRKALLAHGFTLAPGGARIHIGPERPPEGARFWLKIAAEPAPDLSGRNFSAEDLRMFCLLRHYRKAPAFSWWALEEAQQQRTRLRAIFAALSARGKAAPHWPSLSAYQQRFSQALAVDLDTPLALSCLWEALKPGALPPGSQRTILQNAADALGLTLV